MKLDLKLYLARKDNIFVLIILLLTVLWGFFGISSKPWQNWELAAVVFTFIYAVVLYFNGFFNKNTKHFEKLENRKVGLIVLGIILLALVSFFLIANFLHEFNDNFWSFDRRLIMGILF